MITAKYDAKQMAHVLFTVGKKDYKRLGKGLLAADVLYLCSWQPTHDRVVPGDACTKVRMLCTSRPSASSACR